MATESSVGRGCALCEPSGEFEGRPFLVCTERCTAEIRGLSVRQPWAWAIARGGKTVENRTRGTQYRGLLAIHASKTVYREDLDNPLILAAIAANDFEIDEPASRCGAIVAVAELRGCHDEGGGNRCSPWAVRGQWHWNLFDVRPLPDPVPCRGMLGLWRLPEGVEQAVRTQLEVARG